MKTQTKVKTYFYESVLFDTGTGSNTMSEGFHFDEIKIEGMKLLGNHEYPLTFNLNEQKVLGSATMRIEKGRLLGNLQSLTPLLGMYPNIGFQVHNYEDDKGVVRILDCSLRAVGVGPGENTDPNVPRIGAPSEIKEEIIGEDTPDYDAAL